MPLSSNDSNITSEIKRSIPKGAKVQSNENVQPRTQSQPKAAARPKPAVNPQANAPSLPSKAAAQSKPPVNAQPNNATKKQQKAPVQPKAAVNAQPNAPSRPNKAAAQSKPPVNAQPNAVTINQQKATVQPKTTTKSKPEALIQEKSLAKTLANLTFVKREPYKLSPEEQEIDKRAFVLANNDLKILRPGSKNTSEIFDNIQINALCNPMDPVCSPLEITLTHDDVMKFIHDVSKVMILTNNMTCALENIAYRIKAIRCFNVKEILLLLKLLARVEPFSVPLLSCFDLGLYVLTSTYDLKEFTPKEIIDLAYAATKIARPITGNIRVGLAKLVNYIMSNIAIEEIVKFNLLPRVIKILHFIEKCQEEVKIDANFKNEISSRIKKKLAINTEQSSPQHKSFSERLRLAMERKGIIVEDEYFCDLTGTHLDIAIPEFYIVIEINGSSHYNDDRLTENPETKFKRELLEAFKWKVVPVNVDSLMDAKKENLDNDAIDKIIFDLILPLIGLEKEEGGSRLISESKRNFFLCRKIDRPLFHEYKTAKEYIDSIEKIEDSEEAERRFQAEDQEMLNKSPTILYDFKNRPQAHVSASSNEQRASIHQVAKY